MRKFKRVITSIIAILFASVGVAGCALFERDVNAYNNLVVARVGDDITIVKRELVDAFDRFGYQYVTSQNMSIADAYDETLNALIHREILAKLSANTFGFGDAPLGNVTYVDTDSPDGKKRVGVTVQEAEDARKASFTVMENTLKEMEKKARESKNLMDRTTAVTTPETTVREVYKPYEKFMYKDPITYTTDVYKSTMDGSGNITMTATGEKRQVTSEFRLNLDKYKTQSAIESVPTNEEFIEKLKLGRNMNSALEKEIAEDAFKRLGRLLRENEKGITYSGADATDEAYVMRKLVQLQKEEEKNILTLRLQEIFEHGITTETDYQAMLSLRANANFNNYEVYVASKNQKYLEDLTKRAEDEYKRNLLTAIDRYERGFDSINSYAEKLLNGLDGIYYVPKSVANQFFTVSHILLEYSEEQKAELTKIKTQYEQGLLTKTSYDNALKVLRSKLRATRYDSEGNPDGSPMTAEQVLSYVENYVMPNNNKNRTLEEKTKAFRDMIYMFNTDPGMVNPEYEYVIGADLRTNKTATSTEADNMSKMVPEFSAAARELFNYNKDTGRGGFRDGVDTRGTMSGLVWTDYGAHIIMYTRNISDFIFTNSRTFVDAGFGETLHASLTSYGEKTIFDKIIEKLNNPAYTKYEEGLISKYKGEHDVWINKKNYKDLRNRKS